ncbi:OB-fold-containig protein [Thioclava sp.]|uniref:OB-fold-containig protein n=1 Tax=Thioclava sp. TaxID=1933450 RepID=UPI003AA9CFFE
MSFISNPDLFPFLLAAGLVVFLLVLEIALMMGGFSSVGDAPDLVDAPDLDFDVTAMSAPELAAEFDLPSDIAAQVELDLGGYDSPTAITHDVSGTSAGGILDVLGMRKVPMTVWLAIFLALFAGAGLVMQTLLSATFGWTLPRLIAVPIALVPALALTRAIASGIARLIPRTQTSAISERSLGRCRGVVTIGTARRGNPAQVRITDGYGNTHYTMLEPLSDSDEITQGSEVLVLRLPRGLLRLVPLG